MTDTGELRKELAKQERFNIESRRSLCEQSDRYKAERDALAAGLVSLRGQLTAATELAEVAVRQSSDQPNNDLLWARMMFAKKILAALGGAR